MDALLRTQSEKLKPGTRDLGGIKLCDLLIKRGVLDHCAATQDIIDKKVDTYQVGDELEPLPEALKDAADKVGVVEQGQGDQKDVERVPHRFPAL